MDIDVVIAVSIAGFEPVRSAFEDDFLVGEPTDVSGRLMASLVSMASLAKVDLMLARDDAWSRSEMARRQRWDHPEHGLVWVATLEDLLLAKLEWSGGTSELQLRDCRNLVAANRETIDWPYLERWARSASGSSSGRSAMRPAGSRALVRRYPRQARGAPRRRALDRSCPAAHASKIERSQADRPLIG